MLGRSWNDLGHTWFNAFRQRNTTMPRSCPESLLTLYVNQYCGNPSSVTDVVLISAWNHLWHTQLYAFGKHCHSIIQLVYDKLCSFSKSRVAGLYLLGTFTGAIVLWYGGVFAAPAVGDLFEQTLSVQYRRQTKTRCTINYSKHIKNYTR